MIPHAIEAGLGQLGKHGSLINERLGCSFRLSASHYAYLPNEAGFTFHGLRRRGYVPELQHVRQALSGRCHRP